MKLEDCKVGMLVLATKKSFIPTSMEAFLEECPLRVAPIVKIVHNLIDVRPYRGDHLFTFLPEDLILLQETNENK